MHSEHAGRSFVKLKIVKVYDLKLVYNINRCNFAAESSGNRECRFFLNSMVYSVNRFTNITNCLVCCGESISPAMQGKTNPNYGRKEN